MKLSYTHCQLQICCTLHATYIVLLLHVWKDDCLHMLTHLINEVAYSRKFATLNMPQDAHVDMHAEV